MKEKIWNWCKKHLNEFLSWLIIYFVLLLIWVGAEYTFESSVHMGYVDTVVCGILSFLINKRI